ncbi:MAG: hypothetical protein II917_08095 [Synergistaceae bacterium]|nr:hypothetical protein [Synergistaceae bacterium]
MRIANNLPALTAYRELNATNNALAKSVQSLTSGLRINSSADDAAGFAISEKMRSQISGLDTAIQSTQDGISLLQTAEGAISQTNSMLMRMRELAVQASNDSLTSQDRQFLQLEIDELRDQINRIADTTQFNKKRILDGSSGALWSSSDLSLKATINKGLISIDQFGQKVNHEGNYKIQIEADPGQGQVQKSNIMNVARTEYETRTETFTKYADVETIRTFTEKTITTKEEKEISIILDGGDSGEAISNVKEAINLDEITNGWNFNASSSELTITEDGVYRIIGTNSMKVTQNHIVIAEGVNAQIILDGVNIDASSSNSSAFEIKQGAKAEIFLANTNRLKSAQGRAGIEVTGSVDGSGAKAEVVINSATSPANSLDGVLEVTGGSQAAAIGGAGTPAANGKAGKITINGGTIIAHGGTDAAGIGGGYTSGYNGGGTITINGGDVTAISPLDAGIGTGLCGIPDSGQNNDGTVITITGGKIKAKGGGGSGAGIGGGLNFWSGEIKIKSGIKVIEDSPASSDSAFLVKAQQITKDNTGSFVVYAVKGSSSTAAIGHGKDAGDTPNGIDLNANLPEPDFPDVPANPKAMVEEQSVILEEHVEYIKTGEDETITLEVTEEVTKNLTLDEISQFHTDGGASIVEPYKEIMIAQGDGKTASVIIYPEDTMYSVADKINDAIANSLGQAAYTNVNNKFCTIAEGVENTSESVYSSNDLYDDQELFKKDDNGNYMLDANGRRIPRNNDERYKGKDIYSTMLVRSAIPGKEGELYFSGDEDLLQALGLNTIQESSESKFTASVYNAHTGQPVAKNVKATDSSFVSLIPPDIDITVDAMAGISSSWDETTKRFIWARKDNYEAVIHLKNNGISFQTGANSGEDFMIDLGDMSCEALNLSGVNLLTRESASRSISTIDRAINKVSGQRAKIGAYENALEHTMNNLKTTSLNITAADSRIRDADMAKEMMNFVKNQILNQSGTSMLAQANQLPSSVQNLFQ